MTDYAIMDKTTLHRWLSRLLMAMGALWLGSLIYGAWDQVKTSLSMAHWQWLGVSALLCATGLLPSAGIYRRLLRVHGGLEIPFIQAARLHFVGQVIRYLPGRVWGVVYQLNEIRALMETHRFLRMTVDFSLLYLIFNLLVPLAVIGGFAGHPGWALVVLLGGSAVTAMGFQRDWWGAWIAGIRHLLPQRFAQYRQILAQRVRYSWADIVWLFAVILLGWGLYLLAWLALGRAFQQVVAVNFLVLCAAYTLAWLVGFLSLLTPGGLAVREAVFVMLSTPVADPGLLAVLALFIRFWLMVAELLLCLVFIRPQPLTTAPQ